MSIKCHEAREMCGCYGSHGRHKEYSAEELHLNGVTFANAATRREEFCKMMKDATKDDTGRSKPLPDCYKDNNEKILKR